MKTRRKTYHHNNDLSSIASKTQKTNAKLGRIKPKAIRHQKSGLERLDFSKTALDSRSPIEQFNLLTDWLSEALDKQDHVLVTPSPVKTQTNTEQHAQTHQLTQWSSNSIITSSNNHQIPIHAAHLPYVRPGTLPSRDEIQKTLADFLKTNQKNLDKQLNTTFLSCHSRAYRFCNELKEKGYQPAKVWKFWNDGWHDETTDLEWTYHVSVGIEDNANTLQIFDPWWYQTKASIGEVCTDSTKHMPFLSLAQWSQMGTEKAPSHIVISSAEQNFYDGEGSIERLMSILIDCENLDDVWQSW